MKGKRSVADVERAWAAITPVPDRNGDYFKYVPHPASLEFLSEAKGIDSSDANRGARQKIASRLYVAMRASAAWGVDHKEPLAAHWNTEGYKCQAELRLQHSVNPDNLQLVSDRWNKSKGSDGQTYREEPAGEFTSTLGSPRPSGAGDTKLLPD